MSEVPAKPPVLQPLEMEHGNSEEDYGLLGEIEKTG